MAYEIKARSLGELLDGAFQLYRNHFGMFLGATALIWVPMITLASAISWAVTGTLQGTPNAAKALSQIWMVVLVTVPVYYLARILQDAVITIAVADAYLGHKVSMKQAFRRVGSVLGPLLGTSILGGIAIWIAFLFLIVPGILLTLNWLFTVQAITLEGSGVMNSLRRSGRLASGRWGDLFLIVLSMSIIHGAISLGIGALIPDSVLRVPIIAQIAQQIPNILLAPLSPAIVTLAYFDARVKREGFDIELQIQGLDAPAATPLPVLSA